jgi:galactokinase
VTTTGFDPTNSTFERQYGTAPSVLHLVPGCLTLMGTYPDRAGLAVLGICTGEALRIAAAPADDGSVETSASQFEGSVRLDRMGRGGSAPWHGPLASAVRQMEDLAPGKGAHMLISGDLPFSGSLGWPMALITGVIASLNTAWDCGLGRDAIVRRAILAGEHTGLEHAETNAMLLAFAQSGEANLIEFSPARRTPVALPDGLRLVVAFSGEEPPDAATAREISNTREAGARLAAVMIADQVGIELESPFRLGDVAAIDVADILADGLPEKISPVEVSHGAGVDLEQFVRLRNGQVDPMTKIPVRRVALHVLSEADRVRHAEAALRAGEVEAFGKLLDDSHDSLRQDLRCSTPALDRLCAAMRKAGAYGARMAGGGFGGFAVAAVAPERLGAVMEAATTTTDGPAFEVHASEGFRLVG